MPEVQSYLARHFVAVADSKTWTKQLMPITCTIESLAVGWMHITYTQSAEACLCLSLCFTAGETRAFALSMSLKLQIRNFV